MKPTLMTSIYDQHDKAFANVSAFVIAKDGKRVATIAFKLPRDGVGRLYAYVHWLGEPMVRGWADGYGYDKRSAACADYVRRSPERAPNGACENETRSAFRSALARDDGERWGDRLRASGFDVWQAV